MQTRRGMRRILVRRRKSEAMYQVEKTNNESNRKRNGNSQGRRKGRARRRREGVNRRFDK